MASCMHSCSTEHMYSQDEGFSPGVDVGLEGRGKVLVQVQRDCWRCFQFEGQCTTLLMRESQTLQVQTCDTRVTCSIWLDSDISRKTCYHGASNNSFSLQTRPSGVKLSELAAH